jgi:L-asparaginase II
MGEAVALAEIWRGDLRESVHVGHAVVVDGSGAIRHAWGDPSVTIYPRSACKMIQALPLVEAGVALPAERLALVCASHKGAAIHRMAVTDWLGDLDLTEADLRCGTQVPDDDAERTRLIRADEAPCQIHNNCSGKHTGFLMQAQRLKAGPEYIAPDHPVQRAVLQAFEEVTGEASPGYGVDGCSAPNWATSLHGLGRAMAAYATAREGRSARETAMVRLREGMMARPEMVEGESGASTELMRAARGRAALKGGAEGVYVAILPDLGLGVALKAMDGAGRAAECAIATILSDLGVLDPADPVVARRRNPPITSRRGLPAGAIRPMLSLS